MLHSFHSNEELVCKVHQAPASPSAALLLQPCLHASSEGEDDDISEDLDAAMRSLQALTAAKVTELLAC